MPVITYTQSIPAIKSLKDVRIEPSIYEGSYLMSSMFGTEERGIRLVRYAPILMVAPIISGPVAIDEPTGSALYCWRGVVDSAPTALATYQWRLDGVDIPGETSDTLFTLNSMDKTIATCFVRHENNQGFIEVESNGIPLSRIEEIVVDEAEFYSITGQSSETAQNVTIMNEFVVTGIGVEDSISAYGSDSYMVTGLEVEDNQSTFGLDVYMVSNFALDSVLTIINDGAESGIANWGVSQGVLESVTSAPGVSGPNSGTNFFYASTGPVEASQPIDLPVPLEATVDAGELFVAMEWFQNSQYANDSVHMWVSFLDAGLAVISDNLMFGPVTPIENLWNHMNSGLFQIPPNTRSFIVHMDFTAISGTDVNAYVDDISLSLYVIDYT